ncbi:hypothetical protein C5167_025785 [Papaver somniferum]|uniref:Uncharacterized protein n=1 Tax=Papaver somniferum TaxID=3469 RepID=A0A4Y7JTK3_PAPSO|nr:hypothetical protein C5167_025785 [Papaver somniferum]
MGIQVSSKKKMYYTMFDRLLASLTTFFVLIDSRLSSVKAGQVDSASSSSIWTGSVEYIASYFGGDDESSVLTGKKESMGNLCAYQFWQRAFKDKHRVERLKHLLKFDEPNTTKILFPKLEEEWFSFHNLLQPSLHQERCFLSYVNQGQTHGCST